MLPLRVLEILTHDGTARPVNQESSNLAVNVTSQVERFSILHILMDQQKVSWTVGTFHSDKWWTFEMDWIQTWNLYDDRNRSNRSANFAATTDNDVCLLVINAFQWVQ